MALIGFRFRKTTCKTEFSGFFSPLRNHFLTSINETRAPTSGKYVVEQGLLSRNWSKIFQTFWLHLSVFVLEEQPEKVIFPVLLPLINLLMASFNETREPNSRKYVAEQGLRTPN